VGSIAVVSSSGVDVLTLSGDPVATIPLTELQSPDLAGGRLTAVSATGAPTVWDVSSGDQLWSAGETGGVLAGPVLSADGDRVAYQRRDGTVVVVDLTDGGEVATFPLPSSVENQQAGLAFSADATAVYAALETYGSSPGEIQVWDLDPAHWSAVACASAGRVLTDDTLDTLTGVSHLATTSCAYRP
jgi:WD40 repeat protein